MRRSAALTALVAATLTVGVLSGCTGSPGLGLGGDCRPSIEPGDASALVTATGRIGAVPDVDFPTPLIPDRSERTVLVEGTGDPVPVGGVAQIRFTAYNAETGEFLSDTFKTATNAVAGDSFGALTESLVCVRPGSRIALVTSESQVSGTVPSGPDDPTYVVVIDVGQTWLGRANGVNQLPLDGMPTVVTAVDGQPGILVPAEAAPKQSRSSTIKAGGGAALAKGDVAVLHIRAWSWPVKPGDAPVQTSDTWVPKPQESGQPVIATPVTTTVSPDMREGKTFYAALKGAKVGSQLLVVVSAHETGDVATIYVVDVLGIDADSK